MKKREILHLMGKDAEMDEFLISQRVWNKDKDRISFSLQVKWVTVSAVKNHLYA